MAFLPSKTAGIGLEVMKRIWLEKRRHVLGVVLLSQIVVDLQQSQGDDL
jgi:hypothetical protein